MYFGLIYHRCLRQWLEILYHTKCDSWLSLNWDTQPATAETLVNEITHQIDHACSPHAFHIVSLGVFMPSVKVREPRGVSGSSKGSQNLFFIIFLQNEGSSLITLSLESAGPEWKGVEYLAYFLTA